MKRITHLKKLCSTAMIAAMLLCAKAGFAQTALFTENFNGITTGDNTTLTGSDVSWTANSNLSAAWRTFQAGGALRLGNGNASANLGYITTNNIDLSVNAGHYTVSFDVKGWVTVENQIKVIVTGEDPQYVTYTATMDQPFERVTLNFTGGVANSRIIFETTEKRAFIDNIVVATSVGQTLAAPVTGAPTEITGTSFVANWYNVSGATNYILDVSTTNEFTTYVEGYHNLDVGNERSKLVNNLEPNTQYHYRVFAVDSEGRSANSISSNIMGAATTVLAANSFNKLGLKYYPNPVNNMLNLSAEQIITEVTVYNIAGQKVLHKTLNATATQIDMAMLNGGYYTVTVAATDGSSAIKVIKN